MTRKRWRPILVILLPVAVAAQTARAGAREDLRALLLGGVPL